MLRAAASRATADGRGGILAVLALLNGILGRQQDCKGAAANATAAAAAAIVVSVLIAVSPLSESLLPPLLSIDTAAVSCD